MAACATRWLPLLSNLACEGRATSGTIGGARLLFRYNRADRAAPHLSELGRSRENIF